MTVPDPTPTTPLITDSMICARCDREMVITNDAIGRPRRRCPHCDGVARVRRHPDDVMLPQGLVRAGVLPPIAPGQLRCQGCGEGIPAADRFCARCKTQRAAARRTPPAVAPGVCDACGQSIERAPGQVGRPRKRHADCAAAARGA